MTVKGRLRDEKPMNDAAYDPERDRPLPAPAARPGLEPTLAPAE